MTTQNNPYIKNTPPTGGPEHPTAIEPPVPIKPPAPINGWDGSPKVDIYSYPHNSLIDKIAAKQKLEPPKDRTDLRLDDYIKKLQDFYFGGHGVGLDGANPQVEAEIHHKAESATADALNVKALNAKIEYLTNKMGELDSNISKAVQELNQKAAKPPIGHAAPRFEFVFNADDLRELDRKLSEMESAHLNALRPPEQPISADRYHIPEQQAVAPSMIDYAKDTAARIKDYIPNLDSYTERDTTMARREGWITEPDGTRKCYKNGKLHCDAGPAEIRSNGTQLFYRNGKLHRDGGLPAMVGAGGTQKFAVNGKYHRLGGQPAITWSKSPYRHEWWENGEIKHSLKKDGTQEWYAPGSDDREDAILHRTDGPALIHPNGREEFWLNGNQYRSRMEWEMALTAMNNLREEALDHDLIDADPIDAYEDVEVAEDVMATEQIKPSKISRKTTEEKKMNEKPSFADTLKANAVSAGYRVAATQSTTIVKNAILTIMKNKGADGGAIQGISAFLDTEFGAALISFALGSGMHYVPHFSDDPRVQRLGEEMRVNGMATAGNAVIGEAMAHVLPALTQVLQNLPAVEQSASNVRVEEARESKLAEVMEEEDSEEETTTAHKVMKA